jgi:hypothetical protein
MKFCPHCRKPSMKEAGACPHCRKDLSGDPGKSGPPDRDHAQPSRGTSSARVGKYDDGSDLDGLSDEPIELADSWHPPPRPATSSSDDSDDPGSLIDDAPPRLASSDTASIRDEARDDSADGSAYGGLDGEGPDDEAEIELAAPGGPEQAPRPSEAERQSPAHSAFSRPIYGLAADVVSVEIAPEELAEIAGFGPAPSSLLDSVRYVFKVRSRSAELRAAVQKIAPSLEPARRELETELKRLGERAQVAGYDSAAIASLLDDAAAADARASDAQTSLASERRRHEARIEELDRELDAVRAEMTPPRQREARLSGQIAAKQEEQRQIDLRLQRIDIEIRNAEVLIARHEAPGAPSQGGNVADLSSKADELRGKLPGLRATRGELQAERQHLDAPVAELTREIERVRVVLEEFKIKRAAIAKARDEEDALHSSNRTSVSSQTAEASQAVHAKLAEVGRLVRIEPDPPAWARELFPEIDRKAARYTELRTTSERNTKAAESFDPRAVRKGYIVLAAAGGAILFGAIGLLTLIASLT